MNTCEFHFLHNSSKQGPSIGWKAFVHFLSENVEIQSFILVGNCNHTGTTFISRNLHTEANGVPQSAYIADYRLNWNQEMF